MRGNKLTFALWGVLLAAGAPLGWYLLGLVVTPGPDQTLLYLYLWTSTTVVFSGFGFYLGRLLERVERLADSDRLTGLLNQTAFHQVAGKLHAYCQRESLDQSLIMLDIDHFKQVNDKADHLFGSYVIQEIGRMLAAECRHSDVLARFGGDEFIIFLPSTDADNAARLCDRIRTLIRAKVFRQGKHQTQVTLSFGIASSRQDPLNNLMEHADVALYQSKAGGRDRWTIFNGDKPEPVAGAGGL